MTKIYCNEDSQTNVWMSREIMLRSSFYSNSWSRSGDAVAGPLRRSEGRRKKIYEYYEKQETQQKKEKEEEEEQEEYKSDE